MAGSIDDQIEGRRNLARYLILLDILEQKYRLEPAWINQYEVSVAVRKWSAGLALEPGALRPI